MPTPILHQKPAFSVIESILLTAKKLLLPHSITIVRTIRVFLTQTVFHACRQLLRVYPRNKDLRPMLKVNNYK